MVPPGHDLGAACAQFSRVPDRATGGDSRVPRWARAQGIRNQSSADYQDALLKDRQEWILQELCSMSDLVVTDYDKSESGLFRLP